MLNLYATPVGLQLPWLKNGGTIFPLGVSNGGVDGMDFATGAEVFQFNTNNVVGQQKPKVIYSAWVDATAVTAGKNIQLKTPFQNIVVTGGTQQFVIILAPAPFWIIVTSPGGGTGQVYINLYYFNPLFAGGPGGRASSPISGGSGAGGGGTPGGAYVGPGRFIPSVGG